MARDNYAVGSDPLSVAVGDFNADGRRDLAVANLSSNSVSILLGTGPGRPSFGAPVNYAVGTAPSSVAIGFFNADFRPDLAVANVNSGNVSILLSNANGTFQPAVNYVAGTGPQSVAVGDFNADGRPDLAVANQASNNVSVLLNTPISQQPESVTVCPFVTATFSLVTAAGSGPFTYQWQWQPSGPGTEWAALVDGINTDNLGTPAFDVSRASTPSMNITSISGLGGNFRCIVTNACGSVTSNEATLTICPADFNCDGFVNGDDFDAFVDAFGVGNIAADFDNNGFVNGDDYDAYVIAFEAGC